ncbi:MAG: hydroxymethylbilane synthase [Deltaproteobacteria bacterium]|nr:MAG: hydroxymethylbilane synthase [Deltaproteobacteria bacterium]
MRTLKLGTRGSLLARTQSGHVAEAITRATGIPVELVIITTRGDKVQDRPLAEVGGKGLFTLELEQGLLDGSLDLAVHSMKDMPTDMPEGLIFGAIPKRVDPRDALVGATLDELSAGAVIGTGSARRAAQLRRLRPDLEIRGIRGNVPTRIAKLEEGYDAVVLAAAGLARLDLLGEARELFAEDQFVPAVGQGALAVQCRADDAELLGWLARIHDEPTARAVEAERAFLQTVSGGCSVPAACHVSFEDGRAHVHAMWERDGQLRRTRLEGPAEEAVTYAVAAAKGLAS